SDYQVNEIVITGFNAEYCCLFSSIIASDRGYKVTYIEDATATVNNGDTYEMQDLDIIDFVGCILDWSGEVEVLYFDEFRKKN
ncbi:TPA: isochorismatase family protein, partial [Streptococcus suis]|nr:isochorismatase family protein [Streptococcus suis]